MFEFIIITWLLPNVPVNANSFLHESQQECVQFYNKVDTLFEQFREADDRFHYDISECAKKEEKDGDEITHL